MRELVVDTNVLVGALIKSDQHFDKAQPLYQSMLRGETLLHMSMLVPVEVCGVLRRTRDAREARSFRRELRLRVRQGRIKLYELIGDRMNKAADLAIAYSLKGADATILQIAQELGVDVETYDGDMRKAALEL